IFYDWDGDARADHVGLVESSAGPSLTAIEGNVGDAVGRRRVSKSAAAILGYAVPDFGGDEAEAADERTLPALPVLRRGSLGYAVWLAQTVLIALGFGCGPDGADGDFGPNTEAALRRFQRAKGLTDDGVLGGETWARLLGVSA
nr:peptidoglycan-binding protein [Oscillospiraceae bacterium]